MNRWQKVANWILSWKLPSWVVNILNILQDVIVEVLLAVGKTYVEQIKQKIIAVSKEDISNDEKFNKVFDYIRLELNLSHLKDSAINLLIESLVNKLKKSNII